MIALLVSILYVFVPVLALPLIFVLYLGSDQYAKYYAFLLSFSLAIISFFVYGKSGLDLAVYYSRIDAMSTLPLDVAFTTISGFRQEPISNFVFYIISKSGLPALLPFVSAFFSYFFSFFIFADYMKTTRPSILVKTLAILFVFSANTYLSFATGFRFSSGVTLILIGTYIEFVKKTKSKIPYLLYLSACFFHMGLWPFLLIRLIVNFKKSNNLTNFLVYICFGIWILFQEKLLEFTSLFFSDIFRTYLLDKYSSSSGIYTVGNINATFVFYLKFGMPLMFLVMSYIMRKYYRCDEFEKKYLDLVNLVSIFTLGSLTNKLISGRYLFLLIMISFFLFVRFFRENRGKSTIGFFYVSIGYIALGIFSQMNLFSLEFTIPRIDIMLINLFVFFGKVFGW